MQYRVTDTNGAMVRGFPKGCFDSLLDQLEGADLEHPDICVAHESEWSLSVFRGGVVVLENVEDGDPVHNKNLSRQEVLTLMHMIADGLIDEALRREWKPGNPGARVSAANLK